jgi:hypothetical protein
VTRRLVTVINLSRDTLRVTGEPVSAKCMTAASSSNFRTSAMHNQVVFLGAQKTQNRSKIFAFKGFFRRTKNPKPVKNFCTKIFAFKGKSFKSWYFVAEVNEKLSCKLSLRVMYS